MHPRTHGTGNHRQNSSNPPRHSWKTQTRSTHSTRNSRHSPQTQHPSNTRRIRNDLPPRRTNKIRQNGRRRSMLRRKIRRRPQQHRILHRRKRDDRSHRPPQLHRSRSRTQRHGRILPQHRKRIQTRQTRSSSTHSSLPTLDENGPRKRKTTTSMGTSPLHNERP